MYKIDCEGKLLAGLLFFEKFTRIAWWSGYCYQNKEECDLRQSVVDTFVERVDKNNSGNSGDRHRISKIFLINCFILIITLVLKTVRSSAIAHIAANFLEKALQLTFLW